jgi:hypothetical protein
VTLTIGPRKGALKDIGGSQSDHWNNTLANQAVSSLWTVHSDDATLARQRNATVEALIGIGPKDELEAYVAHVVIRPLFSNDVAHRTATSLETIPARCIAVERYVGDKDVFSSICEVTDSAGDKVFSSFETRQVDKSPPKMVCGTHILTAGTGKYNGIAEGEPCRHLLAPASGLRWPRRERPNEGGTSNAPIQRCFGVP